MVILVLMLGTANKLKSARQIALTGAVSGSTNFDGSGNVSITTKQANIAVITGQMTVNANSASGIQNNTVGLTNTSINYPQGYTWKNCVVIATGLINQLYESDKGYAYGDTFSSNTFTQGQLSGAVTRSVDLQPEKILLTIGNFNNNTSYVYKYKIVLMKIS